MRFMYHRGELILDDSKEKENECAGSQDIVDMQRRTSFDDIYY
jgi:hypothetical protein